MKKLYEWNLEKNAKLKNQRNVQFEDVLLAIDERRVLSDEPHTKIIHQRIMIVQIKEYVYIVPYVIKHEVVFFKTIYPSRKYTKKYFLGTNEKQTI